MSQMRQFHGLQLAIEMAERKRDELAQVVAQAQRQVLSGQQQRQQLQSYANDTDARWVAGGHAELSAELLRHHYQFVERLQHAIGMQDGVIANLVNQENKCRVALVQAEARVAGLKQVLSQRKFQLQVAEQRQEQVRMDEMAAVVYARKMANADLEDAR